jgi:hypothetical protein
MPATGIPPSSPEGNSTAGRSILEAARSIWADDYDIRAVTLSPKIVRSAQ